MVLESLITPLEAEKRPWQMFFLGILFSSVSIILSLVIFKEQSSLIMVFLTAMAAFPITYNTLRLEEIKDEHILTEKRLLVEHAKALSVFLFLFLGVMISCTLWFVFLPSNYANVLFSVQAETIQSINGNIIGSFSNFSSFTTILFNNLRVLSFCILFSFVYGIGAMFILIWNATVIATAIGDFIRTKLAAISSTVGAVGASHYFSIFSIGLLKYSVHGIFEIVAYFVAAIAGGLISISIIRHRFGTKTFERILFDVSELLLIAIGLLLIGAFVEVYITPKLF